MKISISEDKLQGLAEKKTHISGYIIQGLDDKLLVLDEKLHGYDVILNISLFRR